MKKLTLILCLSLVFVACSAKRVPTPKKAQSLSANYFKNYGKDFPTSPFGAGNFEKVTISNIEEISKNFAFVDTVVHLADGHVMRALVRVEKKFLIGWKVVSWEVVGYR